MTAKDYFILLMLPLGFAVGRFFKFRSKKKDRPVQPVCPCGHVFGTHEGGNNCHDRVYRAGDGWRKCACTKYHGPELFSTQLFHPGTTFPE